ncbi:MAG: hypothetical protein U0M50_07345 [Paramuribaculum sp.]
MRKLFRLALCSAMIALAASCNNSKSDDDEEYISTPEDDAEELIDLGKEYQEALAAGDTEKAEELNAEGEKLTKEFEEKYKDDTAAQREFAEALLKGMMDLNK